jgi:hypothetical protein
MTTDRDRFGNVFAPGLPPGTGSLLVKFVPPETLERFGGAEALAKAVDSSVDRLAALLREPKALRTLLLGEG